MGLGSHLQEKGHDKKGPSLWLLKKNEWATRKLKKVCRKKRQHELAKENLQKKSTKVIVDKRSE